MPYAGTRSIRRQEMLNNDDAFEFLKVLENHYAIQQKFFDENAKCRTHINSQHSQTQEMLNDDDALQLSKKTLPTAVSRQGQCARVRSPC